MNKIDFEVLGSQPEPYLVTFMKDEDGTFYAYCTCRAGENRMYCRHRLEILRGKKNAIVSSNTSDVGTVLLWFEGTRLEEALRKLEGASRQASAAQSELLKAKKMVSKIMHNG